MTASAHDRPTSDESPIGAIGAAIGQPSFANRDKAASAAFADPQTGRRWSDPAIIAVACACFAVLSLAGAIRSTGFLESDGGTHFLYARFAWNEPHYLTNVWGRPLCTGLYALPAHFGGIVAVRATSLLMALICAITAYAIARGQGMAIPVLATILTLGQPMVFLHSFSELTELPFAAVIGLAFLAYQRKNWPAMALLAGVSPLGRPEGFGFVVLAAAALVLHRRFLWLLLLATPILAWEYFGWRLNGSSGFWLTWLSRNWPYSRDSVYQSGPLWHFVVVLPVITGPLFFPAMWIGGWLDAAEWPAFFTDHIRRCRLLTAALPCMILVVHSYLYWRGKMASNGEVRYLLVTAPLWAVVCARGWEWAFLRLRLPKPIAFAALAAVTPGMVNYMYRVLPIELSPSWSESQRVADWYTHWPSRKDYPRIMTAHPGVFFFLDISTTDPVRVMPWSRENVTRTPPGTIVFWDPENSTANSDRSRLIFLADMMKAGWIDDRLAEWKSNVNNPPPWANYKVSNPPTAPKDMSLPNTPMLWHIFLSPLDASGHPTPAATESDAGVTFKMAPMVNSMR